MEAIRGSNRAVAEYTDELRRAEHELELAQAKVETLRRKAAGPPYPAPCCTRWEWKQDRGSWGWREVRTCGVRWSEMCGWHGCDHVHHWHEPAPIPLA